MIGEAMPDVAEKMYLTIAEGSIDPQTRIANGEITQADYDLVHEALLGDELYDTVDPATMLIPKVCVDGGYDTRDGASAAGGTFSLVMGDALTYDSYRTAGQKAPEHAATVYGEMKKRGHNIGTHDDTHAHGPDCGCGAEDRLDNTQTPEKPSILGYMARRGDEIRSVLTGLRNSKTNEPVGIEVPDTTHNLIMSKVQEKLDEGYATNGAALRAASVESGGDDSVTTLDRVHVEAMVVIDTRPDKKLNDEHLAALTDGKIKVFYLNAASLISGANETSLNPSEAHDRLCAMLYYNVATASVLAGPGLGVIVL